ncbi:MAG TPA: branched-chain-amino-acid transaminase [Tepidisphaeraceae bacterium]|nr:branched-chain-amino-acid transaminase [Tepidisphaeraceae bacterium]
MSLKIWLDGRLVDKQDAKISVYDHGLLYGDGVFEGIRVYAGKLFKAPEHLRRLYDSAKAIRLTIPVSPEAFLAAIEETVRANELDNCYIRAVVTRGVGFLGIDPNKCSNPSVIIIADQIHVYPKELYEKGIAVITAATIRTHPAALSPRVKSLNYLNNILARIEANDAGVPEAIMLNHAGNVAEGTVQNIFIVRDGRVLTPTAVDGILEGVTRQTMLDLCAQMKIPHEQRTLQKHDLYVADECFLTGTGAEVMPVTRIDGRIVGAGAVGPITKGLIDAFHKCVRQA